MDFIENLLAERLDEAKLDLEDKLVSILAKKLEESKTLLGQRVYALDEYMNNVVQRRGRLKFVRLRVRSGKVQRRKKFSAVKGWTLRRGHLIRMRASEKLHRKLGARRAKIKRRSEKARIHRRTIIAMRKRRALGLRAWSVHPQHHR